MRDDYDIGQFYETRRKLVAKLGERAAVMAELDKAIQMATEVRESEKVQQVELEGMLSRLDALLYEETLAQEGFDPGGRLEGG